MQCLLNGGNNYLENQKVKENKGILPTSATFSTDLHSLGQFIREGSKVVYETVLQVENPIADVTIPSDEDNLDNLNYLAGKTVDFVNKKAAERYN